MNWGEGLLILVNKLNPLRPEYVPPDLVVSGIPFPFEEDLPKKKMRREAAEALEKMFGHGERDGIRLYGLSGYRSYQDQTRIFANNVHRCGEKEANRFSARPGESEHQTGLAMDVTCESVEYELVEEFGGTPEGIWVQQNAPLYGFIIRYPREKEEVTGYIYEPWHLRYVGRQAAMDITTKGMVLEEYLSVRK